MAYVWNELLVPDRHPSEASWSRRRGRTTRVVCRTEQRSRFGDLCARRPWLPGADGEWHAPGDLALEDLPETFRRDRDVEAESFVGDVVAWDPAGGHATSESFPVRLCGKDLALRFTARHLLDLQEVIRAGGSAV